MEVKPDAWTIPVRAKRRELINSRAQDFAQAAQSWYFVGMEGNSSTQAMERIEAALARIDAALAKLPPQNPNVMALVNKHEKLREDVADTLRDLDSLIEGLES